MAEVALRYTAMPVIPTITLQPGGTRPPSPTQKTNILAALGAAAAVHGHTIAEITGLAAALAALEGVDAHTHPMSEISDAGAVGRNILAVVSALAAADIIDGATPYDAGGPHTGDLTLNRNNGCFQAITAATGLNLLNITNGSQGKSLELWVTSDGATTAVTWNTANINAPSDTGLDVSGKILNADELYILKFKHNGTRWMLVTILGGFPIV